MYSLDEGGAPELTCFDEFLERANVLRACFGPLNAF